jgi:hypothetical protein
MRSMRNLRCSKMLLLLIHKTFNSNQWGISKMQSNSRMEIDPVKLKTIEEAEEEVQKEEDPEEAMEVDMLTKSNIMINPSLIFQDILKMSFRITMIN